jgi:hypothetical protein
MITSILLNLPLIGFLCFMFFCQYVSRELRQNNRFEFDGFLKIGVYVR